MRDIILSQRLITELDQLNVLVVYLFGSRAQEVESFSSDIDLGIVMAKEIKANEALNLYKQLYKMFAKSTVFPDDVEIDVVLLQQASLALQFEAINRGKILYERSPSERASYEEYVLKRYMDIKPLLEEYEKVTMEAFL